MKYVRQITFILVLLLAGSANAGARFDVVADGFKGPENLAFDGKGALYLTDTDHLWKVAPDGGKEILYTRDPKVDGKSLCGLCVGPNGKYIFQQATGLSFSIPQIMQ